MQHAKASCFSCDGGEKAKQLTHVKEELQTNLIQQLQVEISTPDVTIDRLWQTTYQCTCATIQNAVDQPVICARRNCVGAFLKGVLGAVVALPLLLIPLCFAGYRHCFFGSHTQNSLRQAIDYRQHSQRVA
ncbi:MAG: hypothetical protein A3J38_02660 [Gammaproteobacteria bacterium RIFCSPHIGHO2_12_FULL_45_9]|nr:MAG: hypothetical protein A3J38_02660 [Gammaproteobacteria bacterium RIFCSPHIGHO2_12_FULL_45_9]